MREARRRNCLLRRAYTRHTQRAGRGFPSQRRWLAVDLLGRSGDYRAQCSSGKLRLGIAAKAELETCDLPVRKGFYTLNRCCSHVERECIWHGPVTDAIALKVKQEVAAKEKAKTEKKTQPKPSTEVLKKTA